MNNALVLIGVVLVTVLLARRARREARGSLRRPPAPLVFGPSIERVAADVRRLHGQRQDLLAQPSAPGRQVRTQALTLAYLDALATACEILEVEPPTLDRSGRCSATELTRVEDALHDQGLIIDRRNVH